MTKLPHDPAVPLLGICLETTQIPKDSYPDCHSSAIYNSQDVAATQIPIDRWTGYRKRGAYIHTVECYSAIKRMK